MVLSPTLINDGKTFIFKVWSWGLGEELNYPVGFEFGRLELQPLYIKAVYEETLKLVHLAQQMDYAPKHYSAKLQRNVSIIKDIQSKNATGKVREQMLSFLDTAPEINDAVKAKMESDISGIFWLYRYCPWMRGMATSQISCNNGIDKKASHVPL